METVRLTPHSRLRRLVMTSRLRLTGSAFQSPAPSHLRENAASECHDRACTGMTERKAFLQLVEGEHSFLGAVVVENSASREQRDCLQAHCRGEDVSATSCP